VKTDKGLKIALIILLIILISIISFVGIFVQNKNTMKNILKEYTLGMDFKGGRHIVLAVDETVNTTYYDKDGKVVDAEVKGGTKKEIPVNSDEVLNTENYLQVKNIIEHRLSHLGVSEYIIRQDEKTGKIVVQLPEDSKTDLALQYIYMTGKFEIQDEQGNILLDNSNLDVVHVGYITETTGTSVLLNIEFNEESVEKLREISNTYVTSKDEDGKDTSKKVIVEIDDSELISTSFSEEISDGVLSLKVGTVSSSNEEINIYLKETSELANLINSGKYPVIYKLEQNRYIQSDITMENIIIGALLVFGIVIVTLIFLIVKYKKKGLIVSISYIGFIAVLLLVLRYTNVIITIEGICAIIISLILNYIFSVYLLNNLKNEEDNQIASLKIYSKTILTMILLLAPALIIGIVLCFANWLPIYSFGAIIFWGILLMLIYNTVITRTLILLCSKNK